MMSALAILISGVLVTIAVIHAYWGTGGYWPAATEKDLARAVVGRPGILRMPPPNACFAVAVVLLGVASWPPMVVGLLSWSVPVWLVLLTGVGIVFVFFARGFAVYVPAWRCLCPEQPFARLDRTLYGPLCLALASGCLVLLIAGSRT